MVRFYNVDFNLPSGYSTLEVDMGLAKGMVLGLDEPVHEIA